MDKKYIKCFIHLFILTHDFWNTIRVYIVFRWMIGLRCIWYILFSIIDECTIWVYMHAQHFRCQNPFRSTTRFNKLTSCSYFLWQQPLDNLCCSTMFLSSDSFDIFCSQWNWVFKNVSSFVELEIMSLWPLKKDSHQTKSTPSKYTYVSLMNFLFLPRIQNNLHL